MIRRACWAATRFTSIVPGFAIAFWIADFVISWNSARWKRAVGAEGRSSSSRCQQIASPSRSGSAARKISSATFACRLRSAIVFCFPGRTSYVGS